jgi:hypothetical protein
MVKAQIDVVIPVHSRTRPVGRAVHSVRTGGVAGVRVIVVCHNMAPEDVQGHAALRHDPDVVFLLCESAGPGPGAPRNAGIAAAEAPFVVTLDSDDWLEPGALRAWLDIARRTGAAAVLPRMRHADGAPVRQPPTRPGRVRQLHPVRDRLSYRVAPLGLVSTDPVVQLGLRYSEDISVGEDLEFSLPLWFSGYPLAFGRWAPRYVVGDDATLRVTETARPVAEELVSVHKALGSAVVAGMTEAARRSVGTKMLRGQIFSAVHNRPAPRYWCRSERVDLAATATAVLVAAPRAAEPLARSERALLDVILDADRPTLDLLAASRARREFASAASLLPLDLRSALHRDAPLRFMAASLLS